MPDESSPRTVRRLSSRHVFWSAVVATVAMFALPLVLTSASAQTRVLVDDSTAPVTAAAAATVPGLPFQMPWEAMAASPNMVFAHYVPNFTLSLDNQDPSHDYYSRNYQNPLGEGGAHQAYGGFTRDRPIGRPPMASTAWRSIDLQNEVRQAESVGINGFVIDIFSFPSNSTSQVAKNVQLMMDAAHAVDPSFRIVLMPDMTSGPGTRDPDGLAAAVAKLGAAPAAYHLPDGRLVVAPFHSETHDAGWWQQFLTALTGKYHTPTAFIPLFLNASANLDAYAPFSYGIADWGNRDPSGNNPDATGPGSQQAKIKAVHAAGLKWMQPVSVQDERPRDGRFWEAGNTQNLRNSWTIAIQDHADIVQMTTWNDYAEGSQFAPSQQHGWSYLDISAYYIAWYKTGQPPPITQDALFLSHRVQPWQASPTFPETKLMHDASGYAPHDTVEALTFLTAPGTVNINVGGTVTTCQVPAGVATCTAPLRVGAVSATVTRDAQVVANVDSSFRVTNTPYVQDLGYVIESNVDGSVVTSPSPSPTPSPSGTTTPSPSPTASDSSTPSPTATPTDTGTPTPSATATDTGAPTPTATPTDTGAPTPTPTATDTGTPTQSPTPTPSSTSPSTWTPGWPTDVTATRGDGSATVSFTPPANQGGSEITGFRVTSNPGAITATGPASPITVTGLKNGTPYTFTVTAMNAAGGGPSSSSSNAVTPLPAAHVSLHLSTKTKVTFGKRLAVTGSITRNNNGVGYGIVTLKRYGPHVVQSVHTKWATNAGTFHFRIRPSANAKYAVIYNGDARNLAARSPKRTVAVAPRISAWGWRVQPSRPRVVVMGHVGPDLAGQRVALYEVLPNQPMHRIGRARIASNGGYRITVYLPLGQYTLQVGMHRTARNAAGFSRTLALPHAFPAPPLTDVYAPGERRIAT